jgi:phosphoribosylpyrophosphate synthetase
VATHGLLSLDAPTLLDSSPIDEVSTINITFSLTHGVHQIIVTNTVPHDLQKLRCNKIKTVDISLLLCEAIRRIYNNESMGPLFKDLTIDD